MYNKGDEFYFTIGHYKMMYRVAIKDYHKCDIYYEDGSNRVSNDWLLCDVMDNIKSGSWKLFNKNKRTD